MFPECAEACCGHKGIELQPKKVAQTIEGLVRNSPALLSSRPQTSCECLPLAKPSQKLEGKGARVMLFAAIWLGPSAQNRAEKGRGSAGEGQSESHYCSPPLCPSVSLLFSQGKRRSSSKWGGEAGSASAAVSPRSAVTRSCSHLKAKLEHELDGKKGEGN